MLFGILLLTGITKSGASLFGIMLAAFTLILGGTLLFALLPRKIPFETGGVPIDLARETRLRDEIQALAEIFHEKMPDEVYLVPFVNAGVRESGRKRIMLLGLPILQALTVSQFRAVLAHEFGHFYAGDTRLGPWIFRARMDMAKILSRLEGNALLSFFSQWFFIAILRIIILGGLSLWWKLFDRTTQYISRKQEYRCDELACYLAGSESLEKGLYSISQADATFELYWTQFVIPLAAHGYCAQVADGYRRFLQAPATVKAAQVVLDEQLAGKAMDPMDSHPPLKARLDRIRSLGIAVANEDSRTAISLIRDLPCLEGQLLAKVMPGLSPSELKPTEWDSAGLEV